MAWRRALGGLIVGAVAGAAAAWLLVRVNGSIVGTHDALVTVGWLAAWYGGVTLLLTLAGGLLRALLLRGASIAAPVTTTGPLARGVAEGALVLAVAGSGHALALAAGIAPVKALFVGMGLAVVMAALFGRRFVARFDSGRVVVAVTALVGALFVAATIQAAHVAPDPPATPTAPVAAPRRVVLVGLDGADWRLLDRLMEQGRLPTLARLAREGVRAPLQSLQPTWSPRLWNTISTGCLPERHGVLDFTETAVPGLSRGVQRLRKEPLLPERGGVRELVELLFHVGWLHEVPVTACQRREPALWNIAGAHGQRVASLNWYASWPAEPVNGYLVSDNNPSRASYLERKFGAAAVGATSFTYPAALQEELAQLELFDPGEEHSAIAAQPFFDDLSDEERTQWAASRGKFFKAFRTVQITDSFVFATAQHLLENDPIDLLALFVSGIDNLSHRSHRRVEIVERWCDYTDALLGKLVAQADARTSFVVVSDHGWEYAEGPLLAHEHGPDGIFIGWGAGFRAGVRLDERPRLVDVAPTIQALLGLPTATTQDGAPFVPALAPDVIADMPPRVASFGRYVAPARPAPSAGDGLAGLQEEGIEKLRELGYVK